MKALTIYQPWASLIIGGFKAFEFRPWMPPAMLIGEDVVIHAGKKELEPSTVAALRRLVASPNWWKTGIRSVRGPGHVPGQSAALNWLDLVLLELNEKPHGLRLPTGVGLGTVRFGDPTKSNVIIAGRVGAQISCGTEPVNANYAWPVTRVTRWPDPVPMKGAQRFWEWPDSARPEDFFTEGEDHDEEQEPAG